MKIAAGLFALTLSLAACAADGDESNTATDEVGSEVAAQDETTDDAAEAADSAEDEASDDNTAGSGDQTDEAMEDDSTEADTDTDSSTDDGTEADDSTDDGQSDEDDTTAGGNEPSAGLLLTALLAQAGLEPTDEILSCVEERGVDANITTTADEQAVQEATLVLFTCAPDELAEILAAETPPPEGTTADDVECVIAETFRYLGSLPTDEAIAALEESEMPDEVRDEVLPIIEDNCGLTEEQASAIFES